MTIVHPQTTLVVHTLGLMQMQLAYLCPTAITHSSQSSLGSMDDPRAEVPIDTLVIERGVASSRYPTRLCGCILMNWLSGKPIGKR